MQGGGSPKSPLYGIWNVEELAINGEVRPAELNDYDRRWRRVIFDAPQWIYFQRTDDSFVRYGAAVDVSAENGGADKRHGAEAGIRILCFERPSEDRLVLDGQMDGYQIKIKLRARGIRYFPPAEKRLSVGAAAGSANDCQSDVLLCGSVSLWLLP